MSHRRDRTNRTLCSSSTVASLCGAQRQDAGAIGKPFCAMLDLSAPAMKRVAARACKGEYAQALAAYRDHFVRKVRGLDYGHFRYHDNRRHYHWPPNVTDQLVGKGAGAGWVREIGLSCKPGSGIALACDAMRVNGVPQHVEEGGFEFEVVEGRTKTIAPVRVPTGFRWDESPNGIVPV